MDCQEVQDKLGDYLDQEMLAQICVELQDHLKHCRDCTVEVDTIQKTIKLFQADTGRSLELPARVTQRLEQALAQEYGRSGSKG